MLLSPRKTWRLIETARTSCYWPPEKLRSPENKFHLIGHMDFGNFNKMIDEIGEY